MKHKLKAVVGITNKTQDGYYIPFFDFDNIDYANVVLNIAEIQKNIKLGFAFIIQSTNGFNVFFLDKITFDGCLYLCRQCKDIDNNYIKYADEKHNFTLRIGKDKKFISYVGSQFNDNELSLAHYNFFNEFFKHDILTGYEIDKDFRFDNNEEIQLVLYMSKKYGYIEVD